MAPLTHQNSLLRCLRLLLRHLRLLLRHTWHQLSAGCHHGWCQGGQRRQRRDRWGCDICNRWKWWERGHQSSHCELCCFTSSLYWNSWCDSWWGWRGWPKWGWSSGGDWEELWAAWYPKASVTKQAWRAWMSDLPGNWNILASWNSQKTACNTNGSPQNWSASIDSTWFNLDVYYGLSSTSSFSRVLLPKEKTVWFFNKRMENLPNPEMLDESTLPVEWKWPIPLVLEHPSFFVELLPLHHMPSVKGCQKRSGQRCHSKLQTKWAKLSWSMINVQEYIHVLDPENYECHSILVVVTSAHYCYIIGCFMPVELLV